MHLCWREESEAAVAVPRVVPVEEVVTESEPVMLRAEAVRKLGARVRAVRTTAHRGRENLRSKPRYGRAQRWPEVSRRSCASSAPALQTSTCVAFFNGAGRGRGVGNGGPREVLGEPLEPSGRCSRFRPSSRLRFDRGLGSSKAYPARTRHRARRRARDFGASHARK